MATFVFRITAPETPEQTAYHTNFCLGVTVLNNPAAVPCDLHRQGSGLKRNIWWYQKVLLRNRTPEESIASLSGTLQSLIHI